MKEFAKVMFVFGTRPEGIKMCPLVVEAGKWNGMLKVVTVVTAQHRQMLDQVLQLFGLVPDYDLNLMKENQSLFDVTASSLIATGRIIEKEKPDIVLVQGDTATTFTASLAAYYNKVMVGHVEAGLRTWNKYSPFPEEINRRLTSIVADIHFAPTERNRANLLREGINGKSIFVTGNTVIDALLWVTEKLRAEQNEYRELEGVDFGKRVILVSGHRRENFGKGFVNLCEALVEIAASHSDIEIVYPVHLNPNVQGPVYSMLSSVRNIKLLKPLPYEPFVSLMDKCYMIISDSGGIQEEAPSLGKPVLVTRDTTERPEAVEVGAVRLVGTDKEHIVAETDALLSDRAHYEAMAKIQNPYGDGHSCERILKALEGFLMGHE